MTPTHALFDVSPVAITIVRKGANGQRIFLKKSDALLDYTPPLVTLPAAHTILKSGDDWKVFYCVVAEPGAEEDCGVGDDAGTGIVDVWKSEEEIADAAHRLLKNKGYVNAMHDALEAEGCHIVENAVALDDIWVGGQCIRKGSWYVGIEPSADFRAQVDAGEITGVSLEGTGYREALLQKADKSPDAKIPNKPGKTNWLERRGGFPRYMRKVIEDLLGSHPEWLASQAGVSHAIQLGVGIVQNWAEGHDGKGGKVSAKTQSKAAAAVAEWERKKKGGSVKKADPSEVARESVRLLKQMAEETLLLKIARKVGLADDELPDELRKDTSTFAGAMAARELDEELPAAFDTLRSVIWRAFYPYGDNAPSDPQAVVSQSIQEFGEWCNDLLSRVTTSGDGKAAIAKALGIDPERLPDQAGTLEDEVDNETAQKILKAQEETNSALQTLVQAITDGKLAPVKPETPDPDAEATAGKKVKKSDADDAPITRAELKKALDEVLVEMATGLSAQPDEAEDETGAADLKKSSDPLKGILA